MNYQNILNFIHEIYDEIQEFQGLKKFKLSNIEEIFKKIKELVSNENFFTILCIDEFDSLFQKSVTQTQMSFKIFDISN